jgi:hypothetical protein
LAGSDGDLPGTSRAPAPFVEDEHTVFLKTIIPSRQRRSTLGKRPTTKLDSDKKELLESVEAASGNRD